MISEIEKYLRVIVPTYNETPIDAWGVETTPDEAFGDYASNVAFRLAKSLRLAPLEVANRLVATIRERDTKKVFADVQLAPPGFINFRIAPAFLLTQVIRVASGRPQKRHKEKIILEFVSANPTGPLTMANGRGGFLGDVLAHAFSYAGYRVAREYYINDAGLQIRRLGESVLASLGLVVKSEEQYQGAYIETLAKKFSKKIKVLYDSTPASYEKIGQLVAAELLKQIQSSIKKAGIQFDGWFSEYRELRKKNLLPTTLKLLGSRGMTAEREGAVWLKTTEADDD